MLLVLVRVSSDVLSREVGKTSTSMVSRVVRWSDQGSNGKIVSDLGFVFLYLKFQRRGSRYRDIPISIH